MKNYLFVCSRKTYEIAKSKSTIGFHDSTNTLNNEIGGIEKGDRIFFYITKEMLIDGYGIVTKELFFSEDKLYSNLKELCARRLGLEIKKTSKIDFRKLIPLLDFIKRKTGVVWSAYLVKNLIKLNDRDTALLEKEIDES